MRESSSQLGIKIERIRKKNYQLSAWGWDENVCLGEMNEFLTHSWLCIHLFPRVNVGGSQWWWSCTSAPGNISLCLEAFLVVAIHQQCCCKHLTEAKNVAKHPSMNKPISHNKDNSFKNALGTDIKRSRSLALDCVPLGGPLCFFFQFPISFSKMEPI